MSLGGTFQIQTIWVYQLHMNKSKKMNKILKTSNPHKSSVRTVYIATHCINCWGYLTTEQEMTLILAPNILVLIRESDNINIACNKQKRKKISEKQ